MQDWVDIESFGGVMIVVVVLVSSINYANSGNRKTKVKNNMKKQRKSL